MLSNSLAASPKPSHDHDQAVEVGRQPGALLRSCSEVKVECELEQGPRVGANGRYLSDDKLDNRTWSWGGAHNTAGGSGGPRTGIGTTPIAPRFSSRSTATGRVRGLGMIGKGGSPKRDGG
jgi:hypothetical protein